MRSDVSIWFVSEKVRWTCQQQLYDTFLSLDNCRFRCRCRRFPEENTESSPFVCRLNLAHVWRIGTFHLLKRKKNEGTRFPPKKVHNEWGKLCLVFKNRKRKPLKNEWKRGEEICRDFLALSNCLMLSWCCSKWREHSIIKNLSGLKRLDLRI